ncbi:MAG: hypothetical protein ACJ8EB_04705 [Allosphingosinicella sp.]
MIYLPPFNLMTIAFAKGINPYAAVPANLVFGFVLLVPFLRLRRTHPIGGAFGTLGAWLVAAVLGSYFIQRAVWGV